MKKFYVTLFFISGIFCFHAFAQPRGAYEYFNVPGPINFGNINYYLAWSASPIKNYYKQQYLAKGDSLGGFKEMVLIDVLEDSFDVKDLVNLKLNSLDQRKQTDAALTYKLTRSPDSTEYIIDYSGSEGFPKVDYLEWNAYRYTPFVEKNGKKGVLLFGISIRSYGDNAAAQFYANLDNTREKIMMRLMAYKMPVIAVRN